MNLETILEKIVAEKKQVVAQAKAAVHTKALTQSQQFAIAKPSLKQALLQPGASGIIAEFKRKSPSKGWINQGASAASVVPAYVAGGASALSILTDETFFGGSLTDMVPAQHLAIPVLRKDFMVDEYQLIEAKAHGAAVVLLIAACLTPAQVKSFSQTARDLGMESLLEIHTEKELDHWHPGIELVGINNRNLKNFEVDLVHAFRLRESLPQGVVAIAESGIQSPETIAQFRSQDFSGFLMGEKFMREAHPGEALSQFVQTLQTQSHAH